MNRQTFLGATAALLGLQYKDPAHTIRADNPLVSLAPTPENELKCLDELAELIYLRRKSLQAPIKQGLPTSAEIQEAYNIPLRTDEQITTICGGITRDTVLDAFKCLYPVDFVLCSRSTSFDMFKMSADAPSQADVVNNTQDSFFCFGHLFCILDDPNKPVPDSSILLVQRYIPPKLVVHRVDFV